MLDALQVRVSGSVVSVFLTGKELTKAIWTHAKRPWAHISQGEATRLRDLIAKRVKEKL